MRLRATALEAISNRSLRNNYFAQMLAVFAAYPSAPAGSYTAGINDGYNFQDVAGTQPVTALEQTCALMKDQSGRNGVSFVQSTSTARVKISARVNELLATDTLSTQSVTVTAVQRTLSFTGSGTVTLSGASTAGPLVGGGSLTFTPTAGSLTLTVTGSVTFAQLNLGSTALRYQSVVTATNYDSVGWPIRYVPDGVDDFAVSAANVDCSGTDKMFLCAGVRKTSDAASGVVAELSATAVSNAGSLALLMASGGMVALLNSNALGSATISSGFAAPMSLVATVQDDIAQPSIALEQQVRLNGAAQAPTPGGAQGTGNFGSYLMYLFMRGGTTAPLQGGVSTFNFIGANITAAERAIFEAYANSKEQAY